MSQEAIPANYDFSFLQPQIIITDVNDVELYRYESVGLWPAGTQDFNLNSLILHYGVNDDHGSLGINIQDDELNFTSSDPDQHCLIPRYANIQLYLGKTLAGVSRWFYGKIMTASVFRPDKVSQEIDLFCVGWGITTRDRLTNMREYQDLQADNITVDDTDTTTRADVLFDLLWESQSHYPLKSLPVRSEITSSPTIQSFKFKQFEQRWQTWAAAASTIAAGIGGYWSIDYDRNAKLNKALSVDSGFLITSDFESLITQNWNSSKLALIAKDAMGWTHSAIDQGYNVLLAHGVHETGTDVDTTGSEDAVFDMSTKHVAAEIVPQDSTMSTIGLMLRRLGTPADDAFVSILSSLPAAGGPRSGDVIHRARIPKEHLQALSDSVDSLVQVSFEKIQIVAGDTYYIMLEKYGTASNTIEWAYETGSGTSWTADSRNGPWTIDNTILASLVTNPARLTNVILVNTTALRKAGGEVREKLIPLRGGMNVDAAQDIMIGLAEIMSKERKTLPVITAYAPDARIPVGQYAIVSDNRGFSTKADIIGVDLQINAFDKNRAIGANTVDLTLQVFE